jgi:hypothetical protein
MIVLATFVPDASSEPTTFEFVAEVLKSLLGTAVDAAGVYRSLCFRLLPWNIPICLKHCLEMLR